jgi:hypothetical protein
VIIYGIISFLGLVYLMQKNLYLDVFRDEKELLVGLDGHVAFDNEGVLKVKTKLYYWLKVFIEVLKLAPSVFSKKFKTCYVQ